jgi:hypothetical protein
VPWVARLTKPDAREFHLERLIAADSLTDDQKDRLAQLISQQTHLPETEREQYLRPLLDPALRLPQSSPSSSR